METEPQRPEFIYEKDFTIIWVRLASYYKDIADSLFFFKYDFNTRINNRIASFEERISSISDVFILFDGQRIGIKIPSKISNDNRIGIKLFQILWKKLDKNIRTFKALQDYFNAERAVTTVNPANPHERDSNEVVITTITPLLMQILMQVGPERDNNILVTISFLTFQENVSDQLCTKCLDIAQGKRWLLNAKLFDDDFRKSKDNGLGKQMTELRHLISFSLALSEQFEQRFFWINIVPLSINQYYILYKNYFKIVVLVHNRGEKAAPFGLKRPREPITIELVSITDEPKGDPSMDLRIANLEEFAKRLSPVDIAMGQPPQLPVTVHEASNSYIKYLAINYVINELQGNILNQLKSKMPPIVTIQPPSNRAYLVAKFNIQRQDRTFSFSLGFNTPKGSSQRLNPTPIICLVEDSMPPHLKVYTEYLRMVTKIQVHERKFSFICLTYIILWIDLNQQKSNSDSFFSFRKALGKGLMPVITINKTSSEREVITFLDENRVRFRNNDIPVDDMLHKLEEELQTIQTQGR